MAKGKKTVTKIVIDYLDDLILTVKLFDLNGIDVNNDTDNMFNHLFNDIDLRKIMPEFWLKFICSHMEICVADVFGTYFKCSYSTFVGKCKSQALRLYHIIEDYENQIDEDKIIDYCCSNSKQVA